LGSLIFVPERPWTSFCPLSFLPQVFSVPRSLPFPPVPPRSSGFFPRSFSSQLRLHDLNPLFSLSSPTGAPLSLLSPYTSIPGFFSSRPFLSPPPGRAFEAPHRSGSRNLYLPRSPPLRFLPLTHMTVHDVSSPFLFSYYFTVLHPVIVPPIPPLILYAASAP